MRYKSKKRGFLRGAAFSLINLTQVERAKLGGLKAVFSPLSS
jgi:hypothetical protein